MIAAQRSVLLLVLLGLCMPTVGGCTSSGSNLSDGDILDRRRDGALAVFINRKVTDKLSAPDGDSVDWKYCDIPRAGQVQVAVNFDTPERIEGELVFRDGYGSVIERQRLNGGRSFYQFAPIQGIRGRYYVELAANSGASVYTIGVLFEEPDLGTFFTRPVSKGSGADEGGGRRIGVGPPAGGGGGGAKKERPPEDPTGTEPAPEVKTPEPDTEAISISGTIRRMIPLENGGSLLTIYVGGNNAELVQAGTRGTINGLGAGVTVRRRSGRYVKAFSKAETEAIESYKAVTFRVKVKQ